MKRNRMAKVLSAVLLLLLLPIWETKGYAASVLTKAGGVDYAPIYDYQYYLEKNLDVQQAFKGNASSTLNHFVQYGMQEGRKSSPNFEVDSYRRANSDLRRAFGNNLKQYYLHYLNFGQKEKRTATGVAQLTNPVMQRNGVNYAAVYNYQYYIQNNSDIAKAFPEDDVAVLNHFIQYGMQEGRKSSPNFEVDSYRRANSDLRKAFGTNWKLYYLHYIQYGQKEKRTATGVSEIINPTTILNGVDYRFVYDYDYYTKKYPEIKQRFKGDDTAILNYFVNEGMKMGQQAIATFDVAYYQKVNADLKKAFGNNLKQYYLHYINYGKNEGRRAVFDSSLIKGVTVLNGVDYAAVYDYQFYLDNYSDLKKAFSADDTAALKHFVENGMKEGRIASKNFNLSYYKGNYADLQEAFGSNNKSYYMHYLNLDKDETRNAKEQVHNYTGPKLIDGYRVYTCSLHNEKKEFLALNGWRTENGNKYYYENGVKATGWRTLDSRKYKFDLYGNLESKVGIDVSYAQGIIDWQAVKNDGIDFAIIRVGYGSNEPDQHDKQAVRNMNECQRLGIPYGVYLYSYAVTEDEAKSEASHILQMIQGRNPTLGVFLDIEDTTYYRKKGLNPYSTEGKARLNAICMIVNTAVKTAGYRTGIYANKEYLSNILDVNAFPKDVVWLAQYNDTYTYLKHWDIWQYSETGSVKGINGNVDMNVWVQ